MSKQMQESLQILQMSAAELRNCIELEAQNNPFLELESDTGISLPKNDNTIDDFDNNWQQESFMRYSETNSRGDFSDSIIEETCDLKGHLLKQVIIAFNDAKDLLIANAITDYIDENGYLSESKAEICKNIKCNKRQFDSILKVLTKFEPCGVYAENLSDCLRIQLREAGSLNQKYELLLDHIELLANGDLLKLSKIMGISRDKLPEYISEIKKLDPKPGRNYSNEASRTLIPDVLIVKDREGQFIAALNINSVPTCFLNSRYYAAIFERSKTQIEKKYCTDKLQSANFLLKAIQQRSDTILKIANEIINRQKDFLKYGIDYLKPMTLNDIAKAINVHESTVSRASNKVISTPVGTFEIKFLFTNALSSNISENSYSTLSIKRRIKTMIEAEKPSDILADDKLAELLNDEGINISRRTVAKYREAMELPPSNIRKRLKRI